jgi:Oxidoreductase family, NAD-binding Rossmann fold
VFPVASCSSLLVCESNLDVLVSTIEQPAEDTDTVGYLFVPSPESFLFLSSISTFLLPFFAFNRLSRFPLPSPTMPPQKLKVAAAGLGRMGRRHALNFLNRTPRAELVAAFSPDPAELLWAKEHQEPYGVTLYDDYDTMIQQDGLMAVVIGTATSVHAEEAIKAMERDLHVLCEKPLSTSIDIVRPSAFPPCYILPLMRYLVNSAAPWSQKPESART